MKILFLRESELKNINPIVAETTGLGATETCFIELTRELSKFYEVKVVCPCSDRKYYESVEYIPFRDYGQVKDLIIKHYQPDRFIVIGNPTILFHRAFKGINAIFWQHNHPLEMKHFPINELIDRGVYVIFPSNEAANFAKTFYKKKDIFGIYNGIREDFFKTQNIEKEKKRIVYVGALVKTKGVYELLKITKLMPDFAFHICGDFGMHIGKSEDKDFEKLCKGAAGPNVIFHGALDKQKLIEQISLSEICIVNPMIANKEVFCVSAFEAMALSTPVIIGGLSVIEPLIVNGGISYIRHLDQEIRKLSEDEQKRKILAESGKQFASNFTWPKVAQEWKEFLDTHG
jgi:glycosyltransferase involved in cell wall biosynthesis